MSKFSTWLKNHPCTLEELWKLQNCYGTILGFEADLTKEIQAAWYHRKVKERNDRRALP